MKDRPHIIYVLADDMGYGDVRCNDANGRIPTPNLDRLAERGMRFTDAHASAAVCTPSRYGILTGRYCWRSRLKQGIVWPWDGALIEPDRMTVASLLKQRGYRTACLGKWHLGWDWPTHHGRHPNEDLPFGRWIKQPPRAEYESQIDHAGRLGGGPVDRGFDSYFGVDVPNFPPYTWFENDRVTRVPSVPKPEHLYGHLGMAVPDWSHEAMIPEFTRRAVDLIEQAAEPGADPLFLYYPLTSPHSPIVPNAEFQGRSGIGGYGDFVCEVDWVVGQLADALERTGQADDTLLIFTSDNGPETGVPDDEGVYERARRTRHYSMGPLRGVKTDAWEGGHREPMIACWPGVIPAGSVCDQAVSLVDLMATCADITGTALPPQAGEDSVSMLPLLRGETDQPTRDCLVYHSAVGTFAIRRGPWVFIDAPRGNKKPEPDWFAAERGVVPHDQPGELFHLEDDLAQRFNRYADHPEVVRALSERLEEVKRVAGPTPASDATDNPGDAMA